MQDGRKAVTVHVTGRVQGVSFRAWTQEQAEALDVRGWVRNETDGSVSALLAGSGAAVDEMVRALSHGPRFASVSAVRTEPAEPEPWPQRFAILR